MRDGQATLGSEEVVESLYPLILRPGRPTHLRSDNGPEFTALTFQEWLRRDGVTPMQIYPDSPWENGYNKRFNGALTNEVLNAEWFLTTRRAQAAINIWLKKYNQIHPHQALGQRPPMPETLRDNGL